METEGRGRGWTGLPGSHAPPLLLLGVGQCLLEEEGAGDWAWQGLLPLEVTEGMGARGRHRDGRSGEGLGETGCLMTE